MRKQKRALTYQERSDRNLAYFTALFALAVCVVILVIPSGLDGWNDDLLALHSQSLLQRMASYF